MRLFAHLLLVMLIMISPASADEVPTAVLKTAAGLLPGEAPDAVSAAPVKGFYQAIYGPKVVYISADGKYLLYGDLIDLDKNVNLTEDARKTGRVEILGKLDEAGMVVFEPARVTSTITVFTDTSCGYCVKLHREMPAINAGGVKVRYLGYPRAGTQSPTFETMVSVWCADDPQQAMTDAKAGLSIEKKSCQTAIGRHIEAAQLVGVRGTPTIVLQDGQVIPGYVPAGELVEIANAAAEQAVN